MARIKRSNTKPERVVRSLLHKLGYRFRTQMKGVPGRPDVAFTKRQKAVMIHGCFWHAHNCGAFRMPQTRTAFWRAKFAANRERDMRLEKAARAAGWECITIWECEINSEKSLRKRLQSFLGPQIAPKNSRQF